MKYRKNTKPLLLIVALALAVLLVAIFLGFTPKDDQAQLIAETVNKSPDAATPVDMRETGLRRVEPVEMVITGAETNGTGAQYLSGNSLSSAEEVLRELPDSCQDEIGAYYVKDGQTIIRIQLLYET